MLMSVQWMNDYLDPQASDAEQGDLLTAAGFPLEERIERDDDIALDFEMMSNRGDCTCHLGLAREIAAISGRSLVVPAISVTESDDPVTDHVTVVNEEPGGCPLYTARVIRGVKVAPSPKEIAQRLEARGDIPRNVIVDASNFVLFEMGQPTHAFDLDTLAGGTVIIRMARKGETFLPLGEGATPITLTGEELVIAVEDDGPGVPDGERAAIFDRFSRGSAGGRRGSDDGTGLGLSLATACMHYSRLPIYLVKSNCFSLSKKYFSILRAQP